MKKFYFLFLLLVCVKNLFAQCPGAGQHPSGARPICGTAVFNQSIVTPCDGTTVATRCNDGVSYVDVNPFYYSFTCFVAGPLEFTLKPLTISEDYDWQLFDITNRNPDDIFTDASTVVASNWSGSTGITGTAVGRTPLFACAGNFPLISQAPVLIAGHNYILMVSNFSRTSSGYTLTFSNTSAALITDNNIPRIDTAYVLCGGSELIIKLNKKVDCNTLATDATDFSIDGLPVVGSISGIGCANGGFDVDSIVINLLTPLTAGNHSINIKNGSDGNTLVDFCNNAALINGSNQTVPVYYKPSANFTFKEINVTCLVDTLVYTHDGKNTTNWSWTFDGNPVSSSNQTQQVIYNSFINREVKLIVSNPSCIDSIIQNIPITDHTLVPIINASRDTSCPNILQTFVNVSKGNIVFQSWDFQNGQTSNAATPASPVYPVLPNNKIYPIKLVVQNNVGCIDSTVKNFFVRGTIPTEFDSIIPPICATNEVKIYFNQDMVCTSVATDGSDFVITNGPIPINILSANINCAFGVGTIVTLVLDKSLVTGNYNISIKKGTDGNAVINDCGIETLPKTLTFKAFGRVYPNFTYNVTWGCKQDSFQLFHNANNFSNSWKWYFVDGNPNIDSSYLQNPKVIYSNVKDTHNVMLIVSNGVCIDTAFQKIAVIDHTAKAIIVSPDTVCGGVNTIVTDSSYVRIKKWNWYFGNGDSSKLQNPLPIIYPITSSFKKYQISLKVFNDVGCEDFTEKDIYVVPSIPSSFSNLTYAKCSPDSLIVEFDFPIQCNTIEPNGSDFLINGASNIVIKNAYGINCNNGLSKLVVLKFAQPLMVNGNYFLFIKKGSDGNSVLNKCGLETPNNNLAFIANSKVFAAFSNVVKNGCDRDTLQLKNINTNNIFKWHWYDNNNLINQSSSLNLYYNRNTPLNIKLIVANQVCADTFSQNFSQNFDAIKAKFYSDKEVICPTETLQANDLSSGNIVSRVWHLGNGTILNGLQSISYKYPIPNLQSIPNYGAINTGNNFEVYKLKLVVGNSKPCFDSITKELKVTSNCLITVPTAFTPNGDLLNDNLYPLNIYKATNLIFKVYNRAGLLLKEGKDGEAKWDGKYLGNLQPSGTYIWTLEYTDKDSGERIKLKGTSVLIR